MKLYGAGEFNWHLEFGDPNFEFIDMDFHSLRFLNNDIIGYLK